MFINLRANNQNGRLGCHKAFHPKKSWAVEDQKDMQHRQNQQAMPWAESENQVFGATSGKVAEVDFIGVVGVAYHLGL